MAANTHSRQQPTSKFVPIFYHRYYLYLKQNSVENFGAPEAINSMHASTKNGFHTHRTKSLPETKERRLRLYKRFANGSLQVRLARRTRVR